MKHLYKKKTTIISITIITMTLGIIFTHMYYTHQITTKQTAEKTSEVANPSVTPAQSKNKVIQKSPNKEKDVEDTKETESSFVPKTTQTNNEVSEMNTNPSFSENIHNDNTPAHTHNWIPQYTTVHHDAQYNTVHHDATGHYETQTVSEGYYSEEPKYVTGYADKCLGCGLTSVDFGWDSNAFLDHIGDTGHTYTMAWETWQYGTEQVWHDPVTQQVWVEDSPAYDEQVKVSDAYDEQVVSGYTCSSCGATE